MVLDGDVLVGNLRSLQGLTQPRSLDRTRRLPPAIVHSFAKELPAAVGRFEFDVQTTAYHFPAPDVGLFPDVVVSLVRDAWVEGSRF